MCVVVLSVGPERGEGVGVELGRRRWIEKFHCRPDSTHAALSIPVKKKPTP